jgi:CRP-like cAMP-binding protein
MPDEEGIMAARKQQQSSVNNRLLAALPPEDFAAIDRHAETLDLPRGKVLYEPGETIQFVYFPHTAVISLLAVLEDGRAVEVALYGCEGVLGLASSFVSRESFGRYVVQIPGTASRVGIDKVSEVLEVSPAARELFRGYVEALLTQALQTVACNALHSVEARCCSWILSTHDRMSQDTLPLTHEFLAEMLGVQRSTVSLVTRTLQNAGLITQSRSAITVRDRSGLEEAACECYGTTRRKFARLLPSIHETRPKSSARSSRGLDEVSAVARADKR